VKAAYSYGICSDVPNAGSQHEGRNSFLHAYIAPSFNQQTVVVDVMCVYTAQIRYRRSYGYATCQHQLGRVCYSATSGKQSVIGLECLFCECSSRAGALVVTKKGCLQTTQMIFFAASFDLAWLLAPFGKFFSALRSRFCCALAPFPIPGSV